MVWWSSKNGDQKNMGSKEIGLCAQNMTTISNSTVNIIGGNLYDHLMSTKIFTLIMNEIFMSFEESGYSLDLDLLPMSSYLHFSYPSRSGQVGKCNQLRSIYPVIILL